MTDEQISDTEAHQNLDAQLSDIVKAKVRAIRKELYCISIRYTNEQGTEPMCDTCTEQLECLSKRQSR